MCKHCNSNLQNKIKLWVNGYGWVCAPCFGTIQRTTPGTLKLKIYRDLNSDAS